MPRHLVDHGPTVQPEQNSPAKQAYDAAVAKGPHTIAQPGAKLPLAGIDWTFVSSAGKTIATNLAGAPGAGTANALCAEFIPRDIKVDLENAMSVGSIVSYGRFRTAILGDLLWNVERDLMCPTNRVGTVDLFLTVHHGLDWSNSPQLIHALRPRVAVMNNGTRKGGHLEVYDTLATSPGLEDLWQLHWSYNGMLEQNVPGRFIANIDRPAQMAALILDPPPVVSSTRGTPPRAPGAPAPAYPDGLQGISAHSPAYWIAVSAQSDGTFTVTNTRNGFAKTYRAQR